jgi:hypothetical protein
VEREATEERHLVSALESLKAKHLEELQLLEDSYKYCTFPAKQITYSSVKWVTGPLLCHYHN